MDMSAMDLFMGMLILGGYHLGAAPFLRASGEYFATFSNFVLQLSVTINSVLLIEYTRLSAPSM